MIFFETALSLDTIGRILTTFAIANSLISLAITYVMERRSLARWRSDLWRILGLLWLAIIFPIFELLLTDPPLIIDGVYNPLTKAAFIIWSSAVGYLVLISYRIFKLDLIKFDKSGLSFIHSKEKVWGVTPIDNLLEKSKSTYYPIIIVADEYSRPWRISDRFIVTGLSFGYGVILFSFIRPPDKSFSKNIEIAKKKIEDDQKTSSKKVLNDHEICWENIVVIDCYSVVAKGHSKQDSIIADPLRSEVKNYKVIHDDPNNPHELNKKYEEGLRFLKLKRRCTSIRVVYDTLSDFLYFTDIQLATQYLRHNMVWEEREGVESIYLFREGTLSKEIEQYFLWFSNGVLRIRRRKDRKTKQEYLSGELRGEHPEPQSLKLNFEYGA